MSDISTVNLDSQNDSPKLARVELLESVSRVNALTRSIITSNPALLVVDNNLSVTGNAAVNGNLLITGALSFGTPGDSGQVLTSQGAGQPVTWTTPSAGGGGGGSSIVFNPQSKYQPVTTTGQGVTIVSSATVKTGIAWTRTGTSLTLTDAGHGRSVGERAIVRNTNVSQVDGLITAVAGNTFTITCADTGATSGAAGAYSMGFTFAYNGAAGSITGGAVIAPANCDCVLISVRMHLAANTRTTGVNTFELTIPKGNINGAGPHNSSDDISLPIQQVRQDGATALTAVGNTIVFLSAAVLDIYRFGALPAATTGIHILASF